MPVLPDATLLCCFAIAAAAIVLLAAHLARRNTKWSDTHAAATLVTLATVAYAALSQYYQAPWFT